MDQDVCKMNSKGSIWWAFASLITLYVFSKTKGKSKIWYFVYVAFSENFAHGFWEFPSFFLRAHEFIMQRHINSEPVEQGVIRFRRSFGSNFMNFWDLKQQWDPTKKRFSRNVWKILWKKSFQLICFHICLVYNRQIKKPSRRHRTTRDQQRRIKLLLIGWKDGTKVFRSLYEPWENVEANTLLCCWTRTTTIQVSPYAL